MSEPYWEKALALMQGDPTKLTRDELLEGQVVLVLTMKAAAEEIVRLRAALAGVKEASHE